MKWEIELACPEPLPTPAGLLCSVGHTPQAQGTQSSCSSWDPCPWTAAADFVAGCPSLCPGGGSRATGVGCWLLCTLPAGLPGMTSDPTTPGCPPRRLKWDYSSCPGPAQLPWRVRGSSPLAFLGLICNLPVCSPFGTFFLGCFSDWAQCSRTLALVHLDGYNKLPWTGGDYKQ